MTTTFSEFEARMREQGFDEVLERRWAPGQVVATHSHPFAVDAQVQQGELWLTCGGTTRHLKAGDRFTLACDEPHDERYGPDGALFWAARRHVPARSAS